MPDSLKLFWSIVKFQKSLILVIALLLMGPLYTFASLDHNFPHLKCMS